MSIKERFQKLRARIKEARKGPLRPLDENDLEAANFVIETVKDARANGVWSVEEIEVLIEALSDLKAARKDTPKGDANG